MIPLIREELVSNGWMTTAEITDVIAIAKMTPGPFAVNTATFAGMKIYGVLGAISCTFGVTTAFAYNNDIGRAVLFHIQQA